MLSRIVAPANRDRRAMLHDAERAAAPDPPTVEAIVGAFIAPDLRLIRGLGDRGRVVLRFSGRAATEPSELARAVDAGALGRAGAGVHAALCRAVREVPPDELWRRLSAVIALIASMLAQTPDLGLLDPDDPDGTLRRMVEFLAPGVRAPSARGA